MVASSQALALKRVPLQIYTCMMAVSTQNTCAGGFLRDPMNISLTMSTDGVQLFKSSGVSLWPVHFVINELPPQLRFILINHDKLSRFTRKYCILAGLWCSQDTPPMFQYLRCILERCKMMTERGL